MLRNLDYGQGTTYSMFSLLMFADFLMLCSFSRLLLLLLLTDNMLISLVSLIFVQIVYPRLTFWP